MTDWQGIIEAYRHFLPVSRGTPIITLKEGNTRLIPAKRLQDAIAKDSGITISLHLKCEGDNPTGSFKDRGMTMAISKAVEDGAKAVICASTGNTAASAAAYAARAGLRCIVLIPEGKIAKGKLAQCLIYGAEVIEVQGNFDDALRLVKEITKIHPITLVNSINPYRIEGQKTAAFEICDVLGVSPDYHFIPVGNAGNITAYWKGYQEYHQWICRKSGSMRLSYLPPKMMGFEAEGAAAIVRGYPIPNPETIATAIRIGNPALWQEAVRARDASGGIIDTVTDQEILEAYDLIAKTEGIFCEPSSAVSIAGLLKSTKNGLVKNGALVVATLTGHGLKDPDTAIQLVRAPRKIRPIIEDLAELLK